MPLLNEEAPQPVTVDRLSQLLRQSGRDFVFDPQNQMFMLTCSLATVYVDLDRDVLRVRSVWRGCFNCEQTPDALAFVSRWNREAAGPKGIVHLNDFDLNRLSAQSNQFVGVGLSQSQLEAWLLLALILSHRFFATFEAKVLTSQPPFLPGGSHLEALPTHELTYVPVSRSDNSRLLPLDTARLLATCERMGWPANAQGTVIEVTVMGRPMSLRLFGENTWLSLCAFHNPQSLTRVNEALFLRLNAQNARWPFPVLSLLGSGPTLGLRSDYIVNVGEGMSDRQLDTQLLLGTLAVNQIVDAFNVVCHPHVFH